MSGSSLTKRPKLDFQGEQLLDALKPPSNSSVYYQLMKQLKAEGQESVQAAAALLSLKGTQEAKATVK